MISPAGSTTGIYTVGSATIQSVGMNTTGATDAVKESSILNIYGGSNLVVSATGIDAMTVGNLNIGVPVLAGTESQTSATLKATSDVGIGISFWKSVSLSEDSIGEITGNTGGIIVAQDFSGAYVSTEGLFLEVGSTLKVTATGNDAIGINSF